MKLNLISCILAALCGGPVLLAGGPSMGSGRRRDAVFRRALARYPVSQFDVTTSKYPFRGLEVVVIRARLRPEHAQEGVACQSWWGVKKDGAWLHQEHLSLEGLGGNAGVYVPPSQPSSAFFTMVRYGNYDGQLIKILSDGRVLKCEGGDYLIAPDGRSLVALWSVDGAFRISATDLATGRTLFRCDFKGEITEFYRSGAKLLVQVAPFEGPEGVMELYAIDFRAGKARLLPQEKPQAATPIPWAFQPPEGSDCGCLELRR